MARSTLEAVRARGIEARMLVSGPLPDDAPPYVRRVSGAKWTVLRYLEKLQTLVSLRGRRENLFRFSTASKGLSEVLRDPWFEWADTVHLHWVQQSFLSLSDLGKILERKDKKILWTLHDLWPLTGGCHSPYTLGAEGETVLCGRFRERCGRCPVLRKVPQDPFDLSSRLFREKMSWAVENVTFLAISRKMEAAIKQSPIGVKGKTIFLPNFFDPSLFFVQKDTPRERRILFVAARPDDPVKGLDLAKEALRKASARHPGFKDEFRFSLVGTPKDETILSDWPLPLERIPRPSRVELANLYRTSTLTLSSSRMETFGMTLLESLASGTPVVSFSIDKPSTFLREGTNGSFAPPFDTGALAECILRVCHPEVPFDPETVARTVEAFREDTVMERFILL